ncbi:MAG: 2-oxoglutarate dehydrogenase, E2 component, dihydrolipoamide succinyltransferase, partial [Trueperella sp.]|nr:2-oxoglutarate dehydrogenase, E2 component, dihydrolipoamide succinyltransferase [Trueperella sp.]
VGEDETVAVGTVLGYIGDGSGAAKAEEPADEPAEEAPAAESKPASGGGGGGVEVKMPALGESVDEGTVTTWLKEVGDEIEEDEPILEVSTDKVDTEVPSPAAGILTEIKVGEDETVAVGTVLAIIGGDAPAEQSAPTEEPKEEAPKAEVPEEPTDTPDTEKPKAEAPKSAAPEGGKSAYVTPIVRKLAKDLGVDLESIEGSGVGGRIRRQDIEAAAEAAKQAAAAAAPAAAAAAAPAAAPQGTVKSQIAEKAKEVASLRGTRAKMTGVRRAISKHMVESLATSAQLTTFMEVDVTRIWNLRARAKAGFAAREGVNLTFLPFFVQAATETLKAHPLINSSVEGNEIVYHDVENVGIAVDTDRGLFVPVIKNAGDLNIAGISKAIADLATRTRDGKIKPDELGGSTFTITNTGSAGAIADTPIINQPNVAILGTGIIYKAPGVVKDQDGNDVIAIRNKCILSISYDHRIVDGADASRYLRDVKFRLEEGDFPDVL